jgi:hypothetical protein
MNVSGQQLSPRKRVLILICIMATVTIIVEFVTIVMLYRAAINEEQARLVETAKSQARLIEAIARFDAIYSNDYPKGAQEATLSQIVDAHNHYKGFGRTGEFTLSKKEGDKIVFLLNHRHYDLQNPKPVPFDSELAEPMRLALSGQSGTIIGLDYRGSMVLAAYEPLEELNLGIVAKIDLAEVREPFIKAVLVSGFIGIIAVAVGIMLFLYVTNPLLKKLSKTIETLQDALIKVKLLSGFLPICASCKKIRDDKGYWNQIESYIRDHSEAEFSHGICPECAEKLYPELNYIKKKNENRTT